MTFERPIDLPTFLGALVLAAGAVALLSGALAQDAGTPRLRGLAEPRSSTTLPTLAPRDALQDAATLAKPDPDRREIAAARVTARKTRPRRPRRLRHPTAGVVRPPVRVVARVDPLAVAPEPQPIQVGVPDPIPPPAPKRKRLVAEDPYAQLGLRSGGITFYPAIQESIGYDTNPNRDPGRPKGSFVSRTDAELGIQSDWNAHALTGFLRGGYSAYPNVKGADRPDGEGRLAFRVDVSRDTQADVEGHFQLDTQRPGSTDLNANVSQRPLIVTEGASVGLTQRFNRLVIALRGTFDRSWFEDAKLASGAILDQSDRNANQYGLRLRAGYELTPGVIPFLEVQADTRVYDRAVDNSGFRRSSDGLAVRAGTTFEITRTLTGEVSAGVQQRSYDNPRLGDLRGPLMDAALIWSATPLTTVRLRGQSRIDETTLPNASGSLVNTAIVELQHDLRRNLSVTLAGTISERDYKGVYLKEETIGGSVRLDYKLTRSIVLRASFTHERLKSTSPGADYTASTYLVGLRFQP